MKRAIVDEVEGAWNDSGSVNAPVLDPRDEKTVSEATGEHLYRYETGDVNHPSSMGDSLISGGVANCGVCVR